MLVVMPLKDERESKGKNPPRSALMMECFEPAANAEQMLARLEVIGRHATSALYNAAEHRRIPFRFIWLPLAALQEGLGGKTKAIITSVGIGLVAPGAGHDLRALSRSRWTPRASCFPRTQLRVIPRPMDASRRPSTPLKSGTMSRKGTIAFHALRQGAGRSDHAA